MDNYLIYIGVALVTILVPGPAVVLTLNNSMQRGLPRTLAGIFGVSLGILLVAVISATGVGVLLANSLFAFSVVKMMGAIYLIYLGIKMLRSKGGVDQPPTLQSVSYRYCFLEGFFVSVSNPKAIVFFIAIFPQFINTTQSYMAQFILLAVTFSVLVLMIHTAYALFASLAKTKFSSKQDGAILNKVSGSIFVCFGVGLATASR
ncbi:Homoserine/homoserine lactone efflux protein [Pseudoalteromonas holothuriae]|uniref:Homoserine/homoserine lactone efflux protein n=1 Tax=Pseudoalteromonas holothuriae TaxID=2963714 RepID=A0A9W4W0N8_9GAMM|nr:MULTISPECIES: LysE family translocator [unclassified Pseudoalteromonas]CAH9050244.1 Homoserine/homoserine lactone efflux protein [Pseudoalteromonas sp. CIP111854]CAH9067934.1 Homoserine/homoserine lactone efflux protein [Pseudoalteromonas sp. CIP111951]